MTNDKALEAALDQTIVAKAMACSEWPKWLFDLTDLTNQAADEADMSTEQAVAFAVLSYLSALPGEAEVVAWRHMLTVDLNSDTEISASSEHPFGKPGRDFDQSASVKSEPLVTLASLQAMQARAEKAERELSNMLQGVSDEES